MKKDTEKHQLNRRDALKLAGIGSAAMLLGTQQAEASTGSLQKKPSKTKPLRIVIIGGGMAGTTLAYRLQRAITWPQITVYEPSRTSAWYQPGLTMLGTGVWCEQRLEYKRKDFIPEGVRWIESSVVSIDTDANRVKDVKGNETEYDYLVIASGAVLDYAAIEGLEGEITSLEMLEKKASWMDDPAIGSIYYFHGAAQLHERVGAIVQKAVDLSGDEKLSVLFTQENIHIKSPGATLSALFSLIRRLKDEGVRQKVEITFNAGDGRLSANDAYDILYKKLLKQEGVFFESERLVNVDLSTKTVNFANQKSMGYDFLHVTPAMHAGKLFEQSGLTDKNGWIDVEENTLQHKRFENVFAVGDAAGTTALKTGAAIVDQVKTVVDTMRAIDEGKKPNVSYEGYGCDTVLCVKPKSVLLEAYDKQKKPMAPVTFLDPLRCHELYWYLTDRVLKPYVMYGVMHGWA